MAKITVAFMRDVEQLLRRGEISYSRMVEMLNEKAAEPENVGAEDYSKIKIQPMQATVKDRIAKFREYLDYFERHYDNVQRAWALINEKCDNKGFRFMYDDFVWHVIDAEVKAHDESKLSANEFTQYRNRWFPAKNEQISEPAYLEAWEHHKEHNAHHWQHWTARHSENLYADAFLVMNVVDWVAMGFEFGDTAKDYYEKNKHEIKLPDWAVKLMYQIFDCIYPATTPEDQNL